MEMTTGSAPLKNVRAHAREVSEAINPAIVLKFFTGNNICGLEPETGLCEAYIPSYFYNVTSKRCERFIYGGCGGNDNRFSTMEQCQATCG